MKNKTLNIIGIGILCIWLTLWLLIFMVSDDSKTNFEAINSLFTGLGILGLFFTVFLQYQNNINSTNQFIYNHLFDTTFKQIEVFNQRIVEFPLKINQNNITTNVNFTQGIKYFEQLQDDLVNDFIVLNNDNINSIIMFIYESNSFMFNYISKSKLLLTEKENLQKLYSRGLNKGIFGFIEIADLSIEIDKNNLKKEEVGVLNDALKLLYELKVKYTIQIISDLNFNK